eukprot:gene12606-3310_t
MTKLIGTHDGTFHCDEVLACSFLKMLPEYKHAEIIRSRDPEKLAECDIVVDVGGVYDPAKHRYDHHQRAFDGTMACLAQKKWQTKLSSAGLVYLHFGHQILSQIVGEAVEKKDVEVLYDKLYENFIEEIDAIDNGVNQHDGESRYRITTTLSSRVSYLNPRWNDQSPDPWKGFEKAMELVRSEFLDRVSYFKESWLPARCIVESAIKERAKVHESGEIINFGKGGCPWKDHLFEIEKELGMENKIKYVLFTDQNGKWRVQCVPIGLSSFENRLSLPEEWRGVRDEELTRISGIAGCIFVHASGFIGGNATYEGALEMARQSLNREK